MQVTDSEVRELRDLILGMDKKMDVFIARTDERLSSIDQRLERIEKRADSQDARIWTLIVTAVVALMGLLAKLAFFSDLKV